MALSLLQDAQTRGLAAALAEMKQGDDRTSMSPPMSNSSSSMYNGLHSVAAASALGMLSPQLLANRTAAAAFMASRLPMSSVSSLFPHQLALFGAWAQPSPVQQSNGLHSPPASPLSPITTSSKLAALHTNNNNNSKNNNLLSPSSQDAPSKKQRKIRVKKDLMSPHSQSIDIRDVVYTSGPISPPSSGSSPNSNHEVPVVHPKDPSRDKCFTCKICNRSFGYKHVLQNHERTHTGEKPFECPECHKRFTRDHHLKTHMRLHTGEKPYHCSHCDRQFVQVANLRRHLRVHTGERPYSCSMCDSRFSDSNQLKSHILVHKGEKPFPCVRCHSKFRRRHHLMHHKCEVRSPPTPAISPAISDVDMSDQKSASSSFGSEESNDRLKPNSLKHIDDLPLDLSDERTSHNISRSTIDSDMQGPKSPVFRRIAGLEDQLKQCNQPEQTEPEDLSMRSPRSPGSLQSPHSSHHDDDLEYLDDAATLYLLQKERALLNRFVRNPYNC